MARLDKKVEYCQIYGEKGDEQEGIDLYARKNITDKYSVHQCKNVKDFSASKIKNAVTKFLEGEWVDKSDTFFLCTRESLRSKERADEMIAQTEVLKAKSITFIPWDEEELSTLLKDKPDIVDDFFGRYWVKAFCGNDAAEKLGKKLDAAEIVELRSKCLSLYKTVFNRQDPGLPLYLSSDQALIPFEQRYIIPDVNVDKELLIQIENKNTNENTSKEEDKEVANSNSHETLEYRQRKNVGSWLAEHGQNIILGDPGSGKSSLLRLIAVDLLNNDPKISSIAPKWGTYLPIWVPFGLWTQQIKKGDGGFKDILKVWLKHWGEEKLFTLVDQAIEEKKILLLVDGLDEWTDESAAGLALDQLQVFIDQYKVPAILSSRPQGFAKLQFQKTEWSKARLSDLTINQQKEICSIWFANKIASLNKDISETDKPVRETARREAEQFINELSNNPDLSHLAKTPLLLCLLLAIRFQDGHLPEDRFKAYHQIVSHFIANHPEKRKKAALVLNEQREINNEELEKIYAFLAYKIQTTYPEGNVEESGIKSLIKGYLTDQEIGFGLDSTRADELLKIILQFGEDSAGLLVRKSPSTFGFFHRTFLEFLSAQYISSLSFKEQINIVKKHCSDPQWKEVLLSLFSLTKKQDEIKAFVDAIKGKKLSLLNQCRANFLTYEIAFGSFNCPVTLTRELAIEAFNEIQTKPWLPQRKDLMNLIMNGLYSSKVQQTIKEKLVTWFPNKSTWRSYLYRSMSNWPLETDTIETLKRALYDENVNNQREAGQAISKISKGDKKIGDYLVSIIYQDLDTMARAVAFESLITGWIDHPQMDNIVSKFEDSKHPVFRLLSIKVKVIKNKQTTEDLKKLLILGTWENGVGYEWRGIVEDLLLKGWPGSKEVKKICFESLTYSSSRDDEKLERETAESVLLRGYKGDVDVIDYCLTQIKHEDHPFISSGFRDESWEYLAENFGDNQQIVSAVDEWITKQDIDVVPVSGAALVGRTEIAKKKLLKFLDDHWSFWAAGALIEGWGMEDKEVAIKLNAIATGDTVVASRLGYFIPKIINDDKKARELLIRLLKEPNCERPDFVLKGLIELGNIDGDEEVVEISINRIKKNPNIHYDDMLKAHLIANYSFSKQVLELAKEELKTRGGNYHSVAVGFGSNPEMRKEVLKLCAPIDSGLREIIASRLGENKGDNFSLELLKDYDLEQDDSVKSTAAIAYYEKKLSLDIDVTGDLKQLAEDIVCYGPDHEERRQAAFCGLVILKHLDIMLKAKESIGADRLPAVSIKRGMDINLPFINCILDNWKYIKTVFGDEFVNRFTKFSGVDDFWDSISIYADSHNEVSDDLLALVLTNQLPPKENILQFLARVRPKSEALFDYCLTFVNKFENPRDFHSITHLFAVTQVLGTNFKDNEPALKKIIEGKNLEYLSDSLIALIFEAWPGSKEAKELLEILRKSKKPLSQSTYFEVSTRYFPSKVVLSDLSKLLNDDKVLNQYTSREVHRLIVRRLELDKDLQKICFSRLKHKASPSEKVSIAKLLSESGYTSEEFKIWREKEVDTQFKSGSLDVGFDLSTGSYGVVTKVLINL